MTHISLLSFHIAVVLMLTSKHPQKLCGRRICNSCCRENESSIRTVEQ